MLNDFQAVCPKCKTYAIFKGTGEQNIYRCSECNTLFYWDDDDYHEEVKSSDITWDNLNKVFDLTEDATGFQKPD